MLKLFFCFFVFIAFVFGCSENHQITNPNEKESEEKTIKNIELLFLDNYDAAESNTISNVQAIIGSNVFFSDENGYIHIDSLFQGNYDLQISHNDYISVDTTVSITDSNNIYTFHLSPVMNDYFPLFIGSRWDYNYYYEFTNLNNQEGTIKDGTIGYNLVMIDSLENEILYTFEESFSGNISINDPYLDPPLDTTFYVNDSIRVVGFTEDYNNIIHPPKQGRTAFYMYAISENGLARYQPKSLGDTLSFDNYDGYIDFELIKNVGLTKYLSIGSTNWYGKTKLELIEYKK